MELNKDRRIIAENTERLYSVKTNGHSKRQPWSS